MVFAVIDNDMLKWRPRAILEKWTQEEVEAFTKVTGVESPSGDQLERMFTPEIEYLEGNALTLQGASRITSLIVGNGGQALTATATRLGVGDNTATVGPTDTDLSTGANKYFQVMDATYPQQSTMAMTFKATFPTGVANFAWNTWGLDVGTPTVTSSGTVNALLVNRKAHAMGQKVSGAWALTVIITLM